MRVLSVYLAFLVTASAVALPSERRANVVPSTCDPAVVKTVLNTVTVAKAPETVVLATFETAWVESHFNNLNFGDADSRGVFQQRPSQGWTLPNNVVHATNAFLTEAIRVYKKNPNRSAGAIAQDVQRSAYPLRYEQNQAFAQRILNEARAGSPLTCA